MTPRRAPDSRVLHPGRAVPGRIGLAVLWLTAVLPIAASLAYAAAYSVGLTGLLATGFSLEAWARVLAQRETWASIALSAWAATATVVLAAGVGLALTALVRQRLRSGWVAALAHLPLALPGTVGAFVTYQLFTGGGLASRVAAALGLAAGPEPVLPLVHGPLAAGVVVAHLLSAGPFVALLLVELYDSERIADLGRVGAALGAGPVQVFWLVTVPVLLRRARSSLALLFVVVFGSFEIPLLLGRQSPQMVSVLAARKFSMFDIAQKPEAFAIALLYTAFVLAVIVLLFRRQAPLGDG